MQTSFIPGNLYIFKVKVNFIVNLTDREIKIPFPPIQNTIFLLYLSIIVFIRHYKVLLDTIQFCHAKETHLTVLNTLY